VPTYYKSFDECGLHSQIVHNLKARKWRHMTPIQKAVIPLVMERKNDILALAQTGSGKTASFMLPLIDKLHKYKLRHGLERQLKGSKPYAIVVTPTRELTQQTYNDARMLAEGTLVTVVESYGEIPMMPNLRDIREGCDILVITVGRLKHYFQDQHIDLVKTRYLILDEVDKLMLGDFYESLFTIKQYMNKDVRTLGFSATMFIEEKDKLLNTIFHPNYFLVRVGDLNRMVDSVDHAMVPVTRYEKQDYLINMLMEDAIEVNRDDGTFFYEVEKTLIFVEHRRESDRLGIALAMHGFSAISLSGDRTLKQRIDAIENFQKGFYNIMVATNVAARGLNIVGVEHVINYQLPTTDDQLNVVIHRIGRAGRVGNPGRATSFFDRDSEDVLFARHYVSMLRDSGQQIPKFLLRMADAAQRDEDATREALNSQNSTLPNSEGKTVDHSDSD